MDTYFRKMATAFSIKRLMKEEKPQEVEEEEAPEGLDLAASQAMGRMLAASFPEGVTRENLEKMQTSKPGGKVCYSPQVAVSVSIPSALDPGTNL
eukprot:SAG31_NODE_288_length_18400_cov_55.018851_20_plen_95_part_00